MVAFMQEKTGTCKYCGNRRDVRLTIVAKKQLDLDAPEYVVAHVCDLCKPKVEFKEKR